MLTKLDIAALRKADRIVFAHHAGASTIRAIKENKPSEKEPFARDIEHEISCQWRLEDYAEGDSHIAYDAHRDGAFSAFESVCNYDNCWNTIASLLRENDVVTLEWKRDARRCGYLESATLHGDALDIRIDRGKARLTFHLETSICEDNTARMVRVPWASTRAAQSQETAA